MDKKLSPNKFRAYMLKKISDSGYRSVSDFTQRNNFHRNALARALTGASVPSRDSVNKWCDALGCSPQERQEIMHAAGYHLSPDEIEEEEEIAA